MVKNPPAIQDPRFSPWMGKIPWRMEWLPTLQNLKKSDLEVLFKVFQFKNSGLCGLLSPFCPLTPMSP